LACGIEIAGRRSRHRPLDLLELATLDVREARLDPAGGLALLPLDLLGERALAPTEALVQLVQSAPAFRLRRLELGCRRGRAVLCRPRQLLAEVDDGRALLLALGLEPLGVGGNPPLGLGDQLLLALGNPRDLRRVGLLRPVEIGAPLGEPLLDPPLRCRERLGQARRCLLLALAERVTALVRDPPLLLEE